MKQDLIDLLSGEFKTYPVILQGSLSPTDAYPESFFTIWNTETADWSHYDNGTVGFVWRFTVAFFSVDHTLVNTVLASARSLLIQHGWLVDGVGEDTPTDEISHTGRSLDVIYLERFEPIIN